MIQFTWAQQLNVSDKIYAMFCCNLLCDSAGAFSWTSSSQEWTTCPARFFLRCCCVDLQIKSQASSYSVCFSWTTNLASNVFYSTTGTWPPPLRQQSCSRQTAFPRQIVYAFALNSRNCLWFSHWVAFLSLRSPEDFSWLFFNVQVLALIDFHLNSLRDLDS